VGTGFIYDPSGLILTNSHVAFGRQSIIVTLDDGTSVSAQLVGADPIFDVAVLRIPQPQRGTLLTAVLGDSDRVHIGEEVLAIGNPLGLDQSVTRGIVSAMNRILPETPFSLEEPLIQTDAPINPGNSGGPLLNRCGEVIGISTAIIADAANISFAIPVNLAKAVLPSLLAHGRVIRPWIGFHGQLIDGELLNLFRIPLAEGLLVEAVEPDSPAEHAGLRGGQIEVAIAERDFLIGGDIVLSINDIRLDTPEKLNNVMRALQVGSTVTLKVFRDGEDLEIQYVLPERPILPADIARQRSSSTLAGRTIQRVAPRDWPMRRR
jgi:S1-C subfamily serine protease